MKMGIWILMLFVNLLIVSVTVLVLLFGESEKAVSTAGCVLMFAQLIPLIGCIFSVEKKLRETFDQDGNRKTDRT